MRQWVLSLPFPLRYLRARDPPILTHVLGIVYRAIASHTRGRLEPLLLIVAAVTVTDQFRRLRARWQRQ